MDKTMRGYRQIPVWLKYLINALLLCTLLVLGNHIIASGGVNRAQKAVILQIGIYILLAVSLNVATGYLGQLPLGTPGSWLWAPTRRLCCGRRCPKKHGRSSWACCWAA